MNIYILFNFIYIIFNPHVLNWNMKRFKVRLTFWPPKVCLTKYVTLPPSKGTGKNIDKATTNIVCIQKVETDVNKYVRSKRLEGLRYLLVDGKSDTNMTNGLFGRAIVTNPSVIGSILNKYNLNKEIAASDVIASVCQ